MSPWPTVHLTTSESRPAPTGGAASGFTYRGSDEAIERAWRMPLDFFGRRLW